jgi:hypothetical protein
MPLYTSRHHLITKLLSRVNAIGQVQRFGASPKGPTVCLGNIKVITDNCQIVIDHAWIPYDTSHDWRMGQDVAFSAKVISYQRINSTVSYGFSQIIPIESSSPVSIVPIVKN